MPQAALRDPFHEPDLRNEFRPGPAELRHLFCSDTSAPAGRLSVRKIDERTFSDLERLELAPQFSADMRDHAGADLAGKAEVSAVVVADQQRIDSLGAIGSKAADYKFLLVLELQFQPVGRALPWLVCRVLALRNHALEAGGSNGLNNIRGGSRQYL